MAQAVEVHPNGTAPEAGPLILATRDAWRARKGRSRPIITVPIRELAGPGEPTPSVLMQAMGHTRREAWGLRRLEDEQYEPDEELRKEQDRRKTWGEVLRGNKISLVQHSLVDAHGNLIFAEEDVAELGEENAAALERMHAKAIQLNGLPRAGIPDYLLEWLKESEFEAGTAPEPIEARLKNTHAAPDGSSSSI